MSFTVKDLGIGKLRADIARLKVLRITVGVQGKQAEEKHPAAGVSVGRLASWLHFGNAKVPARPWVDRAIDEIQRTSRDEMKAGISALIDRRADSAEAALEPAAVKALDAVRHSFDTAREWAEPLAQSTVKRKGHDTPLVDTGTVRDAQSWALRYRGKIVQSGG